MREIGDVLRLRTRQHRLARVSNFAILAVGVSLTLAGSGQLLAQTNGLGSLLQGEPVTGKGTGTAGQTATSQPLFLDATQFPDSDMCASIADACAALGTTVHGLTFPLGATIDARGLIGNQVCAATNITTMLFKCVPQGSSTGATSGKLLLGEVNLYADGPTSGNYTDNVGADPSGIGTPALIIPSFFWGIEGVSRGATAGNGSHPPAGPGTFLSVCSGVGSPINSSNEDPDQGHAQLLFRSARSGFPAIQ